MLFFTINTLIVEDYYDLFFVLQIKILHSGGLVGEICAENIQNRQIYIWVAAVGIIPRYNNLI